MIVTLSERRFATLIRNLEPATVNDSDEEILERIQPYATKLFKHLANFGLRMTNLISQRNAVADFRFELTALPPQFSDDPRAPYVAGLEMLNPVCISVEPSDLPQLAPAMADGFRQYWGAVAQYLSKITPSELFLKLEKAAWVVTKEDAKEAQASTVPAGIQQANFEQWCLEQGLPVPDSAHRMKELQRENEVKAQRERESRIRTHGVSTDWNLSPKEWVK